MFLLDGNTGKIINDEELKKGLAARKPYGDWLEANRVFLDDLPAPKKIQIYEHADLKARQNAFGYTLEDFRIIMEPMASTAYEPTGSMGNDTPLAFLSDQNPILFNYFKQLFAQVSNPPLDAIREELVTSLRATLGEERNLFSETPEHCRQITIQRPVLSNEDLSRLRECALEGLRSETISILFDPTSNGGLKAAMDEVCTASSNAVAAGASILILSDRGVDSKHAPIPSLLATSGIHLSLIHI